MESCIDSIISTRYSLLAPSCQPSSHPAVNVTSRSHSSVPGDSAKPCSEEQHEFLVCILSPLGRLPIQALMLLCPRRLASDSDSLALLGRGTAVDTTAFPECTLISLPRLSSESRSPTALLMAARINLPDHTPSSPHSLPPYRHTAPAVRTHHASCLPQPCQDPRLSFKIFFCFCETQIAEMFSP